MERERFNTLLQDPTKITNSDIKALNEYRKKYPYFQGLYVVVAKALQQREHPKTDAFIKKAAIYSANRSYLKQLIEGDFAFAPQPEVKDEQPTPKAETKLESKVEKPTKAPETKEKATEANTERPVEEPQKAKVKEEEEPKAEAPKPVEKPVPKPEDKSEELDELKATKLRIEALLRGELPSDPEEAPADTKTTPETESTPQKSTEKKTQKNSQVEIIQKFINTDPRFDAKSKGNPYEETEPQEDLALKKLKNQEEFYTETMAELMVKQKKYKKAIHIYEKLGLKFPKKSTYFARQIEKVKSEYNV